MCTPYIIFLFSDSGGIRTHDPQLRRLLLYPTELRNHQQTSFARYLRCKNKSFISFIQNKLPFPHAIPNFRSFLAMSEGQLALHILN